MSSSPAIDLAYEHCREITHLHGANFSVGFRFLPAEKKRAVYAAYAFCRRADDIADEPGTEIERRLDAWQEELERSYAGQPEDPITIALADSLQRFPIPKSGFVALIDGCRQDLIKRRYEDFNELRGYCDLVATSISDISLAIFGYRTPRAIEYGRSLATALQLTNITRDIGDDLQRDRIYLPQNELSEFGVSEADLLARRKSDPMRALILFQVERAEGYFREAQPLVSELEFDARFPTLLMGGVYATVLGKIRRHPFAPLEKRLRLSLPRKLAVIASRLLWPRFA
jgi:15-cis-phytoene synthase